MNRPERREIFSLEKKERFKGDAVVPLLTFLPTVTQMTAAATSEGSPAHVVLFCQHGTYLMFTGILWRKNILQPT